MTSNLKEAKTYGHSKETTFSIHENCLERMLAPKLNPKAREIAEKVVDNFLSAGGKTPH